MTMRNTLFGAALSLLAVGCGPYLQYKSQPPSPSPAGLILVEVRDNREPNAGGVHKDRLGVQAGALGIPSDIKLDSETTVAETVHKLVSEAALSAGVGVAGKGQEQAATARVVIEIQRFWCAGYGGYKGDVTASLMVLDPSGQQIRVPGQPVHGEDGGINCKSIFKKALTDFYGRTKELFAVQQIRDAATGANTRPAPPPAN
jgi:hypothetical protein